MRLKGKVAIVIGATQGIGRCVAERLAQEGAHVVVVASSNLAKAEAVVAAIATSSGSASAAIADVSERVQIDALVTEARQRFGAIDILVNCAGVFYPTVAGEVSEADVARMIDINLKGTFSAVAAVAPAMKAAGSGKIVNISSVAAVLGITGYSVYCATKAGVAMMTRTLALELAPHGININAISPGNTATPMNENIRTQPEFSDFLATLVARTPSKRTYSTPEEIAGMVLFLVSDDARSMHGSTVLMDEGFSAGV
jgi:3-oxoacyl-[acyl-carrier protein] reductase